MNKNKKILLVYTHFSSFVEADFKILSSGHDVVKYHFKTAGGLIKNLLSLLNQFFYLLLNIRKFDSVFIWFADLHSFLPVLFAKTFRKKSLVVIGGYDVARIPALNYGVFLSKFRGFCAINSMKKSSLNLTVSNYVDRKTRWLTKKNNTSMIYNCVNLSEKVNNEIKKENLILTVGLINSENTFYLKGIDRFVETAKLLPGYKFLIIGIEFELLKKLIKNIPSNLEVIGKTEHRELIEHYKKAKIYCQFSRSEAFGIAIVEAMSFGCIPLVTNVGGMPELVNPEKHVVSINPHEIAEKIANLDNSNSHEILVHNFTFRTRSEGLLKVIEKVLQN